MTTLRFLGTGWSHGVPSLACTCSVCREARSRNRRLRSSLLISRGDLRIVVDVGPDFRTQAFDAGLRHIDAVFFTHQHSDHTLGFDDLRRFTWKRESLLPVYASDDCVARLRQLCPYAMTEAEPGKAVPLVEFITWNAPVRVGEILLTPFPVPHGDLPCYGIRIDTPEGHAAYVPDCSDLPPAAMHQLRDLDVMILNALRHKPHPSHLTLEQAVEHAQKVNAGRSLLTHLGCPIDYYSVTPTLPRGVELAHDGLEITLPPGDSP